MYAYRVCLPGPPFRQRDGCLLKQRRAGAAAAVGGPSLAVTLNTTPAVDRSTVPYVMRAIIAAITASVVASATQTGSASSAAAAPVIEVVGPNPLRMDVDPNKLYYEDQGAACTDPVEGNLNMDVVVSGDFVEIGRPGLYHLMYECTNSKGVSAKPAIRTIVVSENFNPGCTTVIVSGRTKGMSHVDKMGNYVLQFTRCERGPGNEGINERPDGRCVQTTVDGSPVFKQAGGKNYMYYYKPHHAWFVDSQFDCTTHCTPLGNPSTAHHGFRAPSMAHQPEAVSSPWQVSRKDGTYIESKMVKVGCSPPPPLPKGYDYQLSATVRLGGVSTTGFGKPQRTGFVVALADTLDVSQGDITIDSVVAWHPKPKKSRRLREALPQSEAAVDVAFHIVNTESRLTSDVAPQLQETMFSQVLASELQSTTGKTWYVEVEPGTVSSPSMTTAAKIRVLAIWVGAIAGLVLLGTTAVMTQRYYQKRATNIMFADDDEAVFVSEEAQHLAAGGSSSGDPNDDGEDGATDTL